MPSKTENVKLGVCRVYFKGKDLGLTKGGVEVEVSTDTYAVEVDQYGKTPIKDLVQGRKCTAKVPMAESTITGMADLMPGSAVVTDGVRPSGTVTFTAQPTAGDVIAVDGVDFTFVSGAPADIYEIRIGANLEATLVNTVTVLNRSKIAELKGGITAKRGAGDTVVIEAFEYDAAYNAITLTVMGADLAASGATFAGGVTATRMRLDVSTGAGLDLLETAGELVLHPLSRPADDLSEDFIIYRASAPGELNFAYKVDAERIFNANFSGYPLNDGRVFGFGDPNA